MNTFLFIKCNVLVHEDVNKTFYEHSLHSFLNDLDNCIHLGVFWQVTDKHRKGH